MQKTTGIVSFHSHPYSQLSAVREICTAVYSRVGLRYSVYSPLQDSGFVLGSEEPETTRAVVNDAVSERTMTSVKTELIELKYHKQLSRRS